MVDAQVKFRFPYSKQCKYGGNLKIRAKANTSTNAEENAAFEALLFIEENFGVTIVDLNFCERVDAENEHMMLTRMLGQIIEVGESVKEMWETFVDTLVGKSEDFTMTVLHCSTGILEKTILKLTSTAQMEQQGWNKIQPSVLVHDGLCLIQ